MVKFVFFLELHLYSLSFRDDLSFIIFKNEFT